MRRLADTVMKVIDYVGRFALGGGKPDGTPRELLDVSRLAAAHGLHASIALQLGIAASHVDFQRRILPAHRFD